MIMFICSRISAGEKKLWKLNVGLKTLGSQREISIDCFIPDDILSWIICSCGLSLSESTVFPEVDGWPIIDLMIVFFSWLLLEF